MVHHRGDDGTGSLLLDVDANMLRLMRKRFPVALGIWRRCTVPHRLATGGLGS